MSDKNQVETDEREVLYTRSVGDNTEIVESDRTINVVFTTGEGGPAQRMINGEYVSFYELLRVDDKSIRSNRLAKGLPILDNHKAHGSVVDSVFGSTRGFNITNGELSGPAQFADDEVSLNVWKKVERAFLNNWSLGFKVYKYVILNERKEGLPVYEAVDWEPVELSLTPVSFETANGTRSMNNVTVNVEDMRVRKMADDVSVATESETSENDKPVADVTRNSGDEVVATEVVANVTRSSGAASIQQVSEIAKIGELNNTQVLELHSRNLTPNEVSAEVLKIMNDNSEDNTVASMGTSVTQGSRADIREVLVSDMANGMLIRSNLGCDVSDTNKTNEAKMFSGMRLVDVARRSVESGDKSTAYLSDYEIFDRAMQGSSDFKHALSDLSNKSLRSGYNQAPSSFESLGRRSDANDFKYKNIIKMSDLPLLEKVNETGEFTYGGVSDSAERYRIFTYGKIMPFTRQVFVNDDLGAITSSLYAWGNSASLRKQYEVWGAITGYDFDEGSANPYVMADGSAYHTAARGNLFTGVDGNMTKDAFANAREKGRLFENSLGAPMNLEYTTVVVPAALETQAESLLSMNITPTKVEDVNPNYGRYKLVVVPLLDSVSSKEWYMFTTNPTVPAFEYAFLSGVGELDIQTQMGFDIDGMKVRARMDFGRGMIDTKGCLKMVGE